MPPLATKILFVAELVGIAHVIAGIAVLVTPAALTVTPLAALHHLTLAAGLNGRAVGVILICAGIMAMVGGSMRKATRSVHATLFAPQQVLLLMQLWCISSALIQGKYPDGYIPEGGAWFILADQIWAWVLAASHSIWLTAFVYGNHKADGTFRAA